MVLFQNCSKTCNLCRTFVAATSEIEKNTQTLKTSISIIHLSDSKIIWQKYSLGDSTKTVQAILISLTNGSKASSGKVQNDKTSILIKVLVRFQDTNGF